MENFKSYWGSYSNGLISMLDSLNYKNLNNKMLIATLLAFLKKYLSLARSYMNIKKKSEITPPEFDISKAYLDDVYLQKIRKLKDSSSVIERAFSWIYFLQGFSKIYRGPNLCDTNLDSEYFINPVKYPYEYVYTEKHLKICIKKFDVGPNQFKSGFFVVNKLLNFLEEIIVILKSAEKKNEEKEETIKKCECIFNEIEKNYGGAFSRLSTRLENSVNSEFEEYLKQNEALKKLPGTIYEIVKSAYESAKNDPPIKTLKNLRTTTTKIFKLITDVSFLSGVKLRLEERKVIWKLNSSIKKIENIK